VFLQIGMRKRRKESEESLSLSSSGKRFRINLGKNEHQYHREEERGKFLRRSTEKREKNTNKKALGCFTALG